MACGCGRSPDGCRGWHSLSEEEYKIEYDAFLQEKEGKLRVTEVEHYTDSLFKFKLKKPDGFTFRAGEFTMINVEGAPKRAYSITSGPDDNFIEFYSIKVPNGPLTSILQKIQIGDVVNVSDKTTGSLLVENLTDGTDLWLLATGTGIAPFISMLCDDYTYKRFTNIHIVWSVRERDELNAFHDWLTSIDVDYIPIVTRDENWQGENQRITTLINEGKIMNESNSETDKVMLCGNMDFNIEIRDGLKAKGWTEGSNRENGSLVLEKAFVG
jgi:ferredoxin--NADP+ reductase|tara:strand:- start:1977 stop:2786 length:810 start_codon:yes stop_codon:yes gene_type:complete